MRDTRVSLAACLAMTILGIVLRVTHLDVPSRTPDERAYTIQATLIAQQGAVASREFVDRYNADDEMWFYPPPIRVGYLYLVAAVMKLSHSGDPRVIAFVSCAASILLLGAVGWIGLRFFTPAITFVALALLSVSPMNLAMARRAWQDEVLGCVAMWMAALCCEVWRSPGRMLWLVLLWVLGSYCLLIKEPAIVIYGLCFLWLLWIFWCRERSVKKSVLLVLFAGLGIATSLAIMAIASGGFEKMLAVMRNNMTSVEHNAYAIAYQSGNWCHYWKGLWMLSPLATLLSLLGIFAVVFRCWRPGPTPTEGPNCVIAVGMILFLLAFMTVASIPRYLHNLRYISPVFGLFFLLAGVGAWQVMALVNACGKGAWLRWLRVLGLAILLTAALLDYLNFRRIFVDGQIPDLANRLMFERSMYARISPKP